jgi:hypothetical protein
LRAQQGCNGIFLSFLCVEAGENEQTHDFLIRLDRPSPTAILLTTCCQ